MSDFSAGAVDVLKQNKDILMNVHTYMYIVYYSTEKNILYITAPWESPRCEHFALWGRFDVLERMKETMKP